MALGKRLFWSLFVSDMMGLKHVPGGSRSNGWCPRWDGSFSMLAVPLSSTGRSSWYSADCSYHSKDLSFYSRAMMKDISPNTAVLAESGVQKYNCFVPLHEKTNKQTDKPLCWPGSWNLCICCCVQTVRRCNWCLMLWSDYRQIRSFETTVRTALICKWLFGFDSTDITNISNYQ